MSRYGDDPWPEAPPPASRWMGRVDERSGTDARMRPPGRGADPDGPAASWGAPAAAVAREPGVRREAGGRDPRSREAPTRPPATRRPPAAATGQGRPPAPAYRSGLRVDAAGRRVRVRVVERFPGQRVRQRTGPWRRIRSATVLVLSALIIGAVVAAGLSAIVWGLSVAFHHASTN